MSREEMLTKLSMMMPEWPGADADLTKLYSETDGFVCGFGWKGLGRGREPDHVSVLPGRERFTKDEYLQRRALLDSLEGVTTSLGASPMTPEEEELPAEEKHTCDRCGGAWWSPMNSECPCITGKQLRYMDRHGEDWIDEFARTATVDEFRGAMRFTLGKYNRRAGKKDELINEIRKMRDYCDRWIAYELEVSE